MTVKDYSSRLSHAPSGREARALCGVVYNILHPLVQSGSSLKQVALRKPWTRRRERKKKSSAYNDSCPETAKKAANASVRNGT